jgi:hypothetical protein
MVKCEQQQLGESQCGWQQGPLPKDTYFWGGVVQAGDDPNNGFYFADFQGDHVLITKGDGTKGRLEPHQVGWFNNCIEHPTAN